MGLRNRLDRMEEKVEHRIDRLSKAYSLSPSNSEASTDLPERIKPLFRYGGTNGTNGTKLMLADKRSVHDGWLTDNAIAFWQWHLEQAHLARVPLAQIKLVRPIEAVLLARGISQNVDPDWTYSHLFLPINPAGGDVPEDGSHWSLLVVSLIDHVAFHYNSLASHPHVADRITKNLSQLIGRPLKFIDTKDVPQQSNGEDCGVFVCLFMDELLRGRLLSVDASRKISMSLRDYKMTAKAGRRIISDAMERERENALLSDPDVLVKDKYGRWS